MFAFADGGGLLVSHLLLLGRHTETVVGVKQVEPIAESLMSLLVANCTVFMRNGHLVTVVFSVSEILGYF